MIQLRIADLGVRIGFWRVRFSFCFAFFAALRENLSDHICLTNLFWRERNFALASSSAPANIDLQRYESRASASGAEMVTVAVSRVPLDRKSESFLDHLDPSMQILPNTAGCYDAEEAIRTARLAREALETDWIKLEVIGDQTTLFPDNEQTLEAARRFGQGRIYRAAILH